MRALVCPPATTFAAGLTTSGLGPPDLALALAQHAAYCAALARCGVAVEHLAAAADHPDSTFIEDTAVIVGARALLTRPGAPSRAGEVALVRPALARLCARLDAIEPPGTLDGGDVCATAERLLIGISRRTNPAGARQLAEWASAGGLGADFVDLRDRDDLLHLKSGLAWLGAGRVAVVDALAAHPALAGFERVRVEPDEAYAANCVRIGDRVLLGEGHPRFEAALRALGLAPLPLALSEFRKMDGGPSCLSLRLGAP